MCNISCPHLLHHALLVLCLLLIPIFCEEVGEFIPHVTRCWVLLLLAYLHAPQGACLPIQYVKTRGRKLSPFFATTWWHQRTWCHALFIENKWVQHHYSKTHSYMRDQKSNLLFHYFKNPAITQPESWNPPKDCPVFPSSFFHSFTLLLFHSLSFSSTRQLGHVILKGFVKY